MIFITSEKEIQNSTEIYKKILVENIIFFQRPLIPESQLINYLSDLYIKVKSNNKEFILFSYDTIIFDIIRLLIKWQIIDDVENKFIYYVSATQIYEGIIRNNGSICENENQQHQMFTSYNHILSNLI